MNDHDSKRHGQAEHLMMAALDGELNGEERAELDRLLAEDPALREEWRKMLRVKEATGAMNYREPPEEVWESYWVSVYNRVERGLGWILLCLGTLVLLGFGIWEGIEWLLGETDIPGFIKIAVFVATFGGTVLLFSVIREKLFTRKTDQYKEIQR